MPNIEFNGGGGVGEAWPAGEGEGVGIALNLNYDAGPVLALNSDIRYCFLSTLDTSQDENDIISPYTLYKINSPYFDTHSLIAKHNKHKQPFFLSLNTQSLQSKHQNISLLLSELASKQINVDILALQETWRIPYTEIVAIPGYTFTHTHRTANRGGGVGFYIKNTITYKVIAELSPFTDNIFESITIEAKIHNKTYLLSSVYRSPNPPANMNVNAQITAFNTSLDTLLSNLNTKKLNTYVFLDSNLNLLHTNTEQSTAAYHDTILNNGYLQTITKATRIQNNHFSLIDHILTNSPSTESQAGVLISDISDHFFTFILPNYKKQHLPPATYTTRDFSTANIDSFKQTLRATTWQTTFNSNTANDSYNAFWTDFKQAYDTHFPKVTRRSTRNKHKICNFLTQELLQARNTKLELHKKYLATPTPENKHIYTKHRNEYNSAIRKHKAQYFEQALAASKNSKKSWEILKDEPALGKTITKSQKLALTARQQQTALK
jgi:hypothetical protein